MVAIGKSGYVLAIGKVVQPQLDEDESFILLQQQ
jgi:hypothetical protein